MIAKEKAKQLYDEHKTLFKHYDANPKLNTGLHEYFKKCAVKTVISIINSTKNQNQIMHFMPCNSSDYGCIQYWLQVKQEIENL